MGWFWMCGVRGGNCLRQVNLSNVAVRRFVGFAGRVRDPSSAMSGSSTRTRDSLIGSPLGLSPLLGLNKTPKIDTHPHPQISNFFRKNPGLASLTENLSSPHSVTFKSFIHSGKRAENEAGRTPPRSMDYVQGLLSENRDDVNVRPPLYNPQVERVNSRDGRAPLHNPQLDSFQEILQERGNSFNLRAPMYEQRQLESNADIVHIKLMRNNAFVTVTDSKGNKKIGVSAGQLVGGGGKLNRYSGEAAAEHIGRKVRQMKTKSVIVKVNGFTFFRRKKDSILSFKDGYSNSRGDMNPVVYLEDTTRKPHNGCRLPKKRRI